jgi:hypothetical protein
VAETGSGWKDGGNERPFICRTSYLPVSKPLELIVELELPLVEDSSNSFLQFVARIWQGFPLKNFILRIVKIKPTASKTRGLLPV